MKATYIFLLCVLGAALLSSVLGNNARGPDDCCFEFFQSPIRKTLISAYYETDARCPLKSVVLITKKFRSICVEPGKDWVMRIIRYLERKSL